MKLLDEARKAALLAGQKIKDALDARTVPATNESIEEMETGSPRTPGYQPRYGQDMKHAAEWPAAREETHDSTEQNHDREVDSDKDLDR